MGLEQVLGPLAKGGGTEIGNGTAPDQLADVLGRGLGTAEDRRQTIEFADNAKESAADAAASAEAALQTTDAAKEYAEQAAAKAEQAAASTQQAVQSAGAASGSKAEAEAAQALAEQAARDAQEAAAQAESIGKGNKGWFATPETLQAKYPDGTGANGWFAIIGSTDTMWLYDKTTAKWKDSGDLAGYYTKEQADALLAEVDAKAEGAQSAAATAQTTATNAATAAAAAQTTATNAAGAAATAQTTADGKAPKNHATSATTYGVGTGSYYGHVKLSDSTSSTNSTGNGYAATPYAVKLAKDAAATAQTTATNAASAAATAQSTANSKAPTSHASSATTYGLGTSGVYGHVKLSDSTTSTSNTSGGVAATPAAVKAVDTKIETVKGKIKSVECRLLSNAWKDANGSTTGSVAPYTQRVSVTGMTADWLPGMTQGKAWDGIGKNDIEELVKQVGYIDMCESTAGALIFTATKKRQPWDITVIVPGVI